MRSKEQEQRRLEEAVIRAKGDLRGAESQLSPEEYQKAQEISQKIISKAKESSSA